LTLCVRHEAAHFDDPRATVGIELEDNRVLDHRFRGDRIEAKSRWSLNALRA
jgi:hypothetical protein